MEEEGRSGDVNLSLEQGIIGGVPATGSDFGIAYNAGAMVCEANQFDWYDGGGLDVAVLSFAEFDREGNVNVSKFNGVANGVGGFINISQSAKKVVFVGSFTAKGLRQECGNGKLKILEEGKCKKLVSKVQQISFSGAYALETGQEVVFVTERAVFRLREKGIELMEIAPGVRLQEDVLDLMEFEPFVSGTVKEMDGGIFAEEAW